MRMQRRKISFVLLVVLIVVIFGGVAKADLGKVDYWNISFDANEWEMVDITEKGLSGEYNGGGSSKLIIYGWGPTVGNPIPHAINPIGIEPNKAGVLELRFEAKSTMPNNKDNAIDICYMGPVEGYPGYTPFDCSKRNFFMIQNPNSPSSHTDANVYDLRDLTDDFTVNAQIWLPDINSSTPRSPQVYDIWDLIISNHTDLYPSVIDGNLPDNKVDLKDFAHFSLYWQRNDCDPNNHWCNFADIDRSRVVDYNDLSLFTDEWLWDANDPNTW